MTSPDYRLSLAVVPDPCEATPEYDALTRPVQLTLEGIAA